MVSINQKINLKPKIKKLSKLKSTISGEGNKKKHLGDSPCKKEPIDSKINLLHNKNHYNPRFSLFLMRISPLSLLSQTKDLKIRKITF
jgi:hypothetical protein